MFAHEGYFLFAAQMPTIISLNCLLVKGFERNADAPTSSAWALSWGRDLALMTSTGTCWSTSVERMNSHTK